MLLNVVKEGKGASDGYFSVLGRAMSDSLLITAKEEQICGLHHSQKWEGTFLSHQVPSSTSA